MLRVLSYARERLKGTDHSLDLAAGSLLTRRSPAEALSRQEVLIPNLIEAKDDSATRYEQLLADLKELSSGEDQAWPPGST